MDWRSKYRINNGKFLSFGDRYPTCFELLSGDIRCKNGAFAILLGEVEPEPGAENTALLLISDVTQEEAERLASLVAEMRGKQST